MVVAFFDLRIGGGEHRRLNLREAIHRVVSAAIGAGSTPEELRPLFPQGKNAWQVLDGQLDADEFRDKLSASKHIRFFLADGELFHVAGRTYALSNQWSQPEWRSAIAAIARKHPELAIDVRDHGDPPTSVPAVNSGPHASLAPAAATQVAKKESMPTDLNLIFYGPPGTGKTYTTIKKAVEIIDGSAPEDRTELVARYATLREKGLIEFVTFHQSYSYEEFVEGIRPVFENDDESEADGSIKYECKLGVFRRLCADADAGARTLATADFDPSKNKVWKLSLGNTRKPEDALVYEECIENDYVLLGYGRGLDFAGADSRDEVFEKLRKKEPETKLTDYDVTAVHTFKNEMEIGDLIVVSHGNHRFRAIGRVTGPYRRLRESEYGQMRPVEWLLVLDESLPREGISNKVFSQATIYNLKRSVLRVDKLRELLTVDREPPNRVLIIDEINRGNIAKILGELITLLEPDKRRGATNEIRVTLPYSGVEFSVPANLYVIGTMNTADRSIALLDTALRRRFRFVEMAPDPDVIKECVGEGGKLGGIDVANLLQVLNDRIELLYDRDHRLGHAYFLTCKTLEDLRDAMAERVVPLLQEYFHEHWERICLVLGCPHDDAGKPIANDQPIVRARSLRAANLLGASTDYEDRFQYAINPDFTSGSGSALRAFFDGITHTEPQVHVVASQK